MRVVRRPSHIPFGCGGEQDADAEAEECAFRGSGHVVSACLRKCVANNKKQIQGMGAGCCVQLLTYERSSVVVLRSFINVFFSSSRLCWWEHYSKSSASRPRW